MNSIITAHSISVIIPLFNEEGSISELYHEIVAVIDSMHADFEIIFVNDGSTDRSARIVNDLRSRDQRVVLIDLARNYGQAVALLAGFRKASHEIIITMDGDLQHAPADIPVLTAKLLQGYDVMCGWRKARQDAFWTRVCTSWIANRFIAYISGLPLHDFGTTLRAYRAEAVKRVIFFGEMHRFLPVLLAHEGLRVAETEIRCRKRAYGRSNYGLERIWKVLLDLIVMQYYCRFKTRPMYFFGAIGSCFFVTSFLIICLFLYRVLTFPGTFLSPLFLTGIALAGFGILSILMGILADVIVRNHYEMNPDRLYRLKDAEVKLGGVAPGD